MKKRKKISLDIDPLIYEFVVEYSNETEKNVGSTINKILASILLLSPDTKKKLARYLEIEMDKQKELSKNADQFEATEINKKIHEMRELYFVLTEEKGLTNKEDEKMKRVYLEDGYVIFPSSWIVLDTLRNPIESKYAGIVEVRNGDKYNAPHFVFFSNKKYGKDYSEEDMDNVIDACVSVYPEFKNIINAQIDYSQFYDENGYLDPEKAIEAGWKEAPEIGLFHIPEEEDPIYEQAYGTNYSHPYGCVIVRNKNKK
jgi:hypothetical protein